MFEKKKKKKKKKRTLKRHRIRWRKYQKLVDPSRLVFIDETWTKSRLLNEVSALTPRSASNRSHSA